MTAHEYLVQVLDGQKVEAAAVTTLPRLRAEIEGVLRLAYGSAPRFYYGGSYGKDTMIREAYDLDIVMYFPPATTTPLRDIFAGVGAALQRAGYVVQARTVALRLPYRGSFHIDVVPGRAQDATFRYATLFKNENRPTTLQTSLKVHIDAVRKTGIRDIVRLMKLWRLRHRLEFSTFALEIVIGQALSGKQKTDYAACLEAVFQYLLANVMTVRIVDPANSNNLVELAAAERLRIVAQAKAALAARYWSEVVW